ncbi:MAG: universal stress protein [Haloarculaceae archaeon]
MTDATAGQLAVAYDDTDAARRAVAFAIDRASLTGERVDVVHAGNDLTEVQIRDVVAPLFEDRDVDFDVAVLPIGGSEDENVSASKALTDYLRRHNYEYLLMGNEKHGLAHSLTEASVSSDVIESQSIPVLLVP